MTISQTTVKAIDGVFRHCYDAASNIGAGQEAVAHVVLDCPERALRFPTPGTTTVGESTEKCSWIRPWDVA